jgi:hypothetical protein
MAPRAAALLEARAGGAGDGERGSSVTGLLADWQPRFFAALAVYIDLPRQRYEE